ncbi:MAG: phasin family protein [Rhizobiales bacterium]|nr:phasin family protein [Hyphomicrobiales bacterium]
MAKESMPFEIPMEMRNAAEHGVVQARQAFDHFMSAAQKALAKVEEQAAVAQAGAKGAGERAIDFAEQNVLTSFDYAQKLVRARDVEEMMRIQAEFVRTQMEALNAQSQELGRSVTQAAQDAAKKTPAG